MAAVVILAIVLVASLTALAFAFLRTRWIYRRPAGTAAMQEIAGYVAGGAMTFLSREYRTLGPFVLVVAIVLALANQGVLMLQGASFVLGAVCSGLAGFVGMRVATAANVRTAEAARGGLRDALIVAFAGGSVMGMAVVGFALLGIWVVVASFLLTTLPADAPAMLRDVVLPLLYAFSLGASSVAFITRVGGGIFTKAADLGADLVGKLEADIPEDDARNPATIADNVGDNVGDVAGMGADLFESYAGALIGTLILAQTAASGAVALRLTALPLVLSAAGVVASLVGIVGVRAGRSRKSPQATLNSASFTAAALAAVLAFPVTWVLLSGDPDAPGVVPVYGTYLVGLVLGIAIGSFTELFTGVGRRPVRAIVRASETGAATNLISGLGLGMLSTAPAIAAVALALLASHALAGIYGVAIASLGMLGTLGIQLAVDAYGPIADNAGGMAAMAELPQEVRAVTDQLDEVGNTTAAIGKGFAIGSAALTAFILFSAFKEQAGIETIDLADIRVLTGVLLGATLPYVFSSMSIGAVSKAAYAMIGEVRRQFRERPGILTNSEKPDYNRCIDISTIHALRSMMLPGIAALTAPIVAGLVFGIDMLAGLLVGSICSGVVLAVFMANSGGAWDNAKKMIEAGASGGSGSDPHRAAVVGDTVGDPFKDTAGPSLNILIKLMAIVSLVILPVLRLRWG